MSDATLGPGRGEALAVPPQRDRPGQGLVDIRRLHLLVHVGEPGHARPVRHVVRVLVPSGQLLSAVILTGVLVTFLIVVYAGW